MNNRRKLLIALGAAPFMPQAVFAQATKQPVLIGVLHVGSGGTYVGLLAEFRKELAVRGWKDGAQVTVEGFSAQGAYDQLPALAQTLAKKNPAVIVAVTSRAVAAAAQAAPRTPVVMVSIGDPVAYGFAKSLSRPGGMITGLSNIAPDTASKYVELLVAAVPGLKRIGFLLDVGGSGGDLMKDSIHRSTAHYSLEAAIAEPRRPEGVEPGLQRLAKEGVRALACMPSPVFTNERKTILQFAAMRRWPVIANTGVWVRDGALLSYGASNRQQFRRAAYYVDRILRGTKPGDLPVELPTTFEMAVNLKTAKALGLTMPPEIMVRATQVIE